MGLKVLGIAIIVLGIIALIALAGCSAPTGPAMGVISSTPAAIEVWARSSIPGALSPEGVIPTDQDMADLAQQHCQANGKDAQKVDQRFQTGRRFYLFHCV